MSESISRSFEEGEVFRTLVEMVIGSLNLEHLPEPTKILIDQIRTTIGVSPETREAYMKGLFMGMVLADDTVIRLDNAVLFMAALIKIMSEDGVAGSGADAVDPWRAFLG